MPPSRLCTGEDAISAHLFAGLRVRRRAVPVIASLLFALLIVGRAQAQDLPFFEETDCMYSSTFSFLSGADVHCGYVTVPERRLGTAQEASKSIRLAVVVLPATGDAPAPDPLFVAQGGPGGSTIDTFVDLLAVSPLREARDIVLFDQRGTLYSEPNLICTELHTRMTELFAASEEEYSTLLAEVTAECRARLTAEGIDLGAYNSLENAADVNDIRRALGYDIVNFYGVSYGSLLGLHLMRDFPEHLRSVILDGVVPTQVNFVTEVAVNEDRVFSALFDACAADARCRTAYGDLEQRFFALVDDLNASPVTLTLLNPTSGARVSAPFFGDDLVDVFFQLFYLSGSPAILPKVLHDVENGQLGYLEAILSSIVFDDTFSDGMYNSVLCAEDADFVPAEIRADGVRPYFSEGFQDELEEYVLTCDLWAVPALGARVDDPVVSEIPTLLLSGAFDPITPPRFGDIGAETLANGHHVVLPTGGHGVAFGVDECVDQIVGAFLAAPQTMPDDGCLPAGRFDFVGTDAVVVPALSYLNTLNSAALRRIGVAALLLAVVLSAFVVWPLGWLVRNLRGTSVDLTADERRLRLRARLLVLGFGAVALSFGTLLGLSILVSTVSNPGLLMLGAVPGYARGIFWLLWLLAIMAVMIAVIAVALWARRQDRLAARIYYLVLTIAAVSFVWILIQDGMLALVLP